MIKNRLSAVAKELGIPQIGFSKNAVVALFPYFVKGERGNLSLYARGLDYHTVAEELLIHAKCGPIDALFVILPVFTRSPDK
jgi:hypothetical protein